MATSALDGYLPLGTDDVTAPVPKRRSNPPVLMWGCCSLFLGCVVGAAVLVALNQNEGPDCRKSAPLALFTLDSHPGIGLRQDLCENEAMFLMFGGKGKHESSFDDVWALCTNSGKWAELAKDGHKHHDEPEVRWKTAHATGKDGLYIMGGSQLYQDDDDPQAAAKNGKDYYNDVWMFSIYKPYGWTLISSGLEACLDKKKKKKHCEPDARRSHTAIMYSNKDGGDVMVIYGGRNDKDEMKMDVWELDVANATWTKLFDAEDGGKDVPGGRKGHIAVPAPHPTGDKPYMVIHGGRPAKGYWGDTWAFDLNSLKWKEWFPQVTNSTLGPEPRDHHVGHYFGGKLYIHGGRGGIGKVWESAKEFSDLWEFDVVKRMWTKLKPLGHKPIGRWLHTAAPVASKAIPRIQTAVPEDDKFVIQGGENMERCYLNDVWQFNIQKNKWEMLAPCTFCQRSCRKSVAPYKL